MATAEKYNEDLIKAFEYLKSQKKIRFNQDVVRDTGYSKTVVSLYLTGMQPASKDFITAFENAYKLKLEDFRNVLKIEYSEEELQKDRLQLKALVKTIFQRVAKHEAKLYGVSIDEALQELENDTKINLTDILNEGK